MSAIVQITISLGVPDEGTPSVYSVRCKKQDSQGYIECAVSKQDRDILLKALTSFMGALLE